MESKVRRKEGQRGAMAARRGGGAERSKIASNRPPEERDAPIFVSALDVASRRAIGSLVPQYRSVKFLSFCVRSKARAIGFAVYLTAVSNRPHKMAPASWCQSSPMMAFGIPGGWREGVQSPRTRMGRQARREGVRDLHQLLMIRKWATCSSAGTLCFNTRLLAPGAGRQR